MIADMVEQDIEGSQFLLHDEDRPFFKMVNKCGQFKSAYAEAALNSMAIINATQNKQRKGQPVLPNDQLDIYIKAPGSTSIFVREALKDEAYVRDLSKPDQFNPQFYGAYPNYDSTVDTKEWLKFLSCLTKEPSYTSYTNFKGCVDYIFYEAEGLFDLVRVLDMPSYSRYLKSNISSLPHTVMPSDHLSCLAEFLVL